MVPIKEKSVGTVAAFDDTWLSRHPRPQSKGFDGGREKKEDVFRETLINHGLGPEMRPATAHNPQANSIVERTNQALNGVSRTQELEDRELDPFKPFDKVLRSSAACAV